MSSVDLSLLFYPRAEPVDLPLGQGETLPDGTYMVDENGAFLTDENGAFWIWE